MENMPERNKDLRSCGPRRGRADFLPEHFVGAKTPHSALFPFLGFCKNWIFVAHCLLFVRA